MNLILLQADDFITENRVRITGRRFLHIVSVLKAKVGQTLQVGRLDSALGTGRLCCIDEQSLELQVHLDQQPPPAQPITLLLALPRPKVLRRILQGVTALGVKQIYLCNSWRVDKSYWQSPLLEPAALREQLVLGLEQARDTHLPQVHLRRRFRPFVEDELPVLTAGKHAFVAHPGEVEPCPVAAKGNILLAVGPEGGFIDFELDCLTKTGFKPVHLGPRALRVETAVAALIGRLIKF